MGFRVWRKQKSVRWVFFNPFRLAVLSKRAKSHLMNVCRFRCQNCFFVFLLFTGLSLFPVGCDVGDYEVGCVDDIVVGEEADEEDIYRTLSVLPCVDGNVLIDNTLAQRISLPALESVGGTLAISLNVGLQEIDLPNLRYIGGDLSITSNPVLEFISLPALTEVSGNVDLIDNPSYPTCDAQALAAQLAEGGGSVNMPESDETCPLPEEG